MTDHRQEATTKPQTETSGNVPLGKAKLSGRIRELSMVILTLLFAQFLLGTWTNLFAAFPAPSPSVNPLDSVFTNGPYILAAHIITGLTLGILSISVLVLSALARNKVAIVLASAGLGSILLAGESGIEFVLGWYANNLLSFSMAVGFALSFAIYFLILSLLGKIGCN